MSIWSGNELVNKKIFALIICIALLLSSCSAEKEKEQTTQQNSPVQLSQLQVKAMWVSCYELQAMLIKGTKEYFEAEINEMLSLCDAQKINTLFVHIRPFCDAMYPSELFGWSEYALSSAGKAPDFDPLKILITMAQTYNIKVHAWINPYRISYDKDFQRSKEIQDFSFVCDQGIYLDPSDIRSQKLVLDGVREIMQNYDVDGIHIDDYFYPQTKDNFDEEQYKAYCESGGKLSKSNWRRENVNSLVSSLYSLVHSFDQAAIFSISPAADFDKNRNEYYADVELWLSREGYADWIIPQIYFGFEHETKPFEKTAGEWLGQCTQSKVKLICGLASYKCGKKDEAAGKGENEWKEYDDIISRQIEFVTKAGYYGYALFSYSSVKSW